ncbi:MAG: hypothetical protein JXO51_10170 [Candidatus Aminicenantes bacterium]|nr:hypothetical protein [Candidatus Aminicenantes bacterium]
MMGSKKKSSSVEARNPTQAELALLEYGKQTLIKSSEIAMDFHKTMLGISATFGTLITNVTPILIWGSKDEKIPMPEGWLLLIPPILMLISAVVFAIGYYPRYVQFNPNVVDDIRLIRERIMKARRWLAGIGLGLFCAAILSLTFFILLLRKI